MSGAKARTRRCTPSTAPSSPPRTSHMTCRSPSRDGPSRMRPAGSARSAEASDGSSESWPWMRPQIKAVSFGSQLDGIVVCDREGRPLRPALIWMDRRAEAQASELARRITSTDFYAAVGVNLDSSHAMFKALWVRDNEPEVFARAALLLPPGSFVLREVTGVVACDFSNASSLGMLDFRTREWSAEILDAAQLDSAMLPPLVAGTAVRRDGHACLRRGHRARTAVPRRSGLRRRDGRDPRCRRLHVRGGLRRRGYRGTRVRGDGGTVRGPDHAGRVSPARGRGHLVVGESRLRLGWQPSVVA